MRTMLKVHFPVDASNKALKDGTLEKTMGKMLEQLKPEAAYFYPEKGMRTGLFVFNLKESSDIVATVEPFFTAMNADVYLTPVMNAEELKAGLGKFMK